MQTYCMICDDGSEVFIFVCNPGARQVQPGQCSGHSDWATNWKTDNRDSITGRFITYLLTPWSRVLLEKLRGFQLVKKFPSFYGTRRFITAITSARHLSLSWANSIQSPQTPPTSWRSILILSSHLRLGLPNGLFPSGFPNKILYTRLFFPRTRYIPCPSNSSRFYHPNNIGRGVQIIKLLIM